MNPIQTRSNFSNCSRKLKKLKIQKKTQATKVATTDCQYTQNEQWMCPDVKCAGPVSPNCTASSFHDKLRCQTYENEHNKYDFSNKSHLPP